MEKDLMYIQVDQLKALMQDVFLGLGVPAADAEICVEILITSDLRGIDSHGVGRLKMYYDRIRAGIQQPVTQLEIIRDTRTTATIDGHNGMGHVIGYTAMQMAIEKAAKYGMGSVAVRNSSHYGIAGYYPLMAIKAGMIGLTVTNARPSIAPTFGVDPMLGTNPLTFGAPTDEPFPFLIDCATSISQRGKIEYLSRAEQPTPAGWAIDGQGEPHTETGRLLDDLVSGDAALLPVGGSGEILGGHKGYGWSVMVEILSAALQDGAFLKDLTGFDAQGKRAPYRLGHFFMAINIENFISLDIFKRIAGKICRELRNSRKATGQLRIYTAGEKEFETEQQRRQEGIPVNKNLQQELAVMLRELKLEKYRPLFNL